jgi:formylglycine-generating enzyme required for sulfatase activity
LAPVFGAQAVKTKDPNSYGLYDMSGNVFEWCNDLYNNYSYCGRLENPLQENGLYDGSYRVFRGGGWDFDAVLCAVSGRYDGSPDTSNYYGGFRVVSLSL